VSDTRKIVEDALGRSFTEEEEAGFPSLSSLPPSVIAAATKLRASNLVTASVYLRHVVPSANFIDIKDFVGDLPTAQAAGRDEPVDDITSSIADLESGDARVRAVALNAVSARPHPDVRLLAACERLLADRAITIVSLPYSFAEVRWLAAEAVAAVRGALGSSESVVIEDVFAPVTASNVEVLAREAGVERSRTGGVDGTIETLECIAAVGKLPRRRIVRQPASSLPPKHPAHLTEEDKAALAKMRANREKWLREQPQKRTQRIVGADSPMFNRWQSEEFPFGVSSEEQDDAIAPDRQRLAESDVPATSEAPRSQRRGDVSIAGWADSLRKRAAEHRARGALLGLAVGDALGTTNEFKTIEARAFPELATGPVNDVVGGGPFKLVAGQVTDDTQMALALADVFAANAPLSTAEIAKRYVAWKDVAFDVGVQIGQVLDLIAAGTSADRAARDVWEQRNRFPAANGSLMRTAVIGVLLAGHDASTRRSATFLDSTVTHFDPKCQLACAAFNAAIAHALTERPSPASMLRAARAELVEAAAALRTHHGDITREIDAAEAALASDLDAAREDDPSLYGDELHLHRGAGFVRVAFRLAFWELMHAPDYRAAVIDAANRGGDADTNAAIVGALLGAFHGVDAIPPAWVESVLGAPGLRAGELDLHPRVFEQLLVRAFAT
jgi:ADP-ribosyl-[dinitrogen reductase] hydrolase